MADLNSTLIRGKLKVTSDADVSGEIKEGGSKLSDKYAAKSHTHSYAGSSSAGGAATLANALTNIAGSDAASSTDTWRYVFMAYNDLATNRPAYNTNFAYQTSTNTLKVPNIAASTSIKVNGTSVVLDNDARLTNARPASDVSAWAKASTKPSYSASEVGALPISGGTMTGNLTLKANQYNREGALNCNNSDIMGVNSIYTQDLADNTAEGIRFYRDTTHWDTFTMSGGVMYFMPNDVATGTALSNANVVLHSGNISSYAQTAAPSNATITIKQAGRNDQTFTLNGSATTINLDNTTYSAATTSANGLMSSTDKTRLDSIWNVWSADGTDDTLVNKVQEVLTAFTNFPEANNLVDLLAAKVPTSRKVNGHALTGDISVTASDVGLGNVLNKAITVTSTSVSDGTNTFNKYTHPTTTAVSAAAKKVGYDSLGHVVLGTALTASDVGARPSTWTPTASDVGALPTSGGRLASTTTSTPLYLRPNSGNSVYIGLEKSDGTSLGSFGYDATAGLSFKPAGGSEYKTIAFTSDLSGYATQTWVTNQGYAVDSGLVHNTGIEAISGVKTFNSAIQAAGGVTLGNANSIKPITMNSSTSGNRSIRLYPTTNNSNNFDIYFPAQAGTLALQEWVSGQNYLTGITSSMVTTALGFTPTANTGTVIGSGLTADQIVLGNGTVNVKISSYKPSGSETTWDSTSDVYLPSMKAIKNYVTGLGYTSNAGTVTSVCVQAGTGLSSSTSTAQSSSLNTTISIDSGYKLPTTTEWNALPTKKHKHNIRLYSSSSYCITFSFITSSETALTYNTLPKALYDAGFNSSTKLCPATGMTSISLKTNLVVGVYCSSSSASGTTLYYGYITLISTSSSTATMQTSPTLTTGVSITLSSTSGVVVDTVEDC